MAKNDGTETTTAAEMITDMELTDADGVDPTIAPPEKTYNPSRVLNLDTKTIGFLEQEKTQFPRKTPDQRYPFYPSTVKVLRGPGGSQIFYEGEGLVDENNSIAKSNKYDITIATIRDEFFRVSNPADRNALFSTMQKLGYYEGDKPSPQALQGLGLTSKDERAMEAFLVLGNRKGRTLKALVNLVATGQIATAGGTSGSGRTISVVSTEDAAKQTGTSFFELLGRAPTPAELKSAVAFIQGKDRSRQLSNTEDPTSLPVAAEEEAKKASPGEFGAYSAGKAINQIFSLLGGQ